jgi:hypothetical protein
MSSAWLVLRLPYTVPNSTSRITTVAPGSCIWMPPVRSEPPKWTSWIHSVPAVLLNRAAQSEAVMSRSQFSNTTLRPPRR